MSAVKGILQETTVHIDLKVQVHLFYLKPYEVRVPEILQFMHFFLVK